MNWLEKTEAVLAAILVAVAACAVFVEGAI
jgi:hypothetical protein